MEEFVRTASLEDVQAVARDVIQRLKSDDPQIVMEGYDTFREVHRLLENVAHHLGLHCETRRNSFRATLQMTRDMQEAALEENAALLVKLLRQMLSESDESFLRENVDPGQYNCMEAGKLLGLGLWSAAAIGSMCMSRRIAQIILRLAPKERIFDRFAACLHCETLFPSHPVEAWTLNSIALRALSNFSQASRTFRALVRSDSQLFPSIFRLLSIDVTKARPLAHVLGDENPTRSVCHFLRIFAAEESCKDSRLWLINQGFCEVAAKILSRTCCRERLSRTECIASLIFLLNEEGPRTMLRNRGAARIFAPVSKNIQATLPCVQVWENIFLMMTTQVPLPPDLIEPMKTLRAQLRGAIITQKFCSWPQCDPTANLQLQVKDLRKCAACKSACYCW